MASLGTQNLPLVTDCLNGRRRPESFNGIQKKKDNPMLLPSVRGPAMLCFPWPVGFGDSLTPDLVQKVDNDIVLLRPQSIEMLSGRVGELFFALPPQLLASCHCGRLEPDASWL